MRKNKIVVLASAVCILSASVVSAELVCGLFYTFETGQLFWTRTKPHEPVRRNASISEEKLTGTVSGLSPILSPYFGYVLRPGSTYGATADAPELWVKKGYAKPPDYRDWGANNFGFVADRDYPVPAGPNDFIVGVFGGSVATFLALDARDLIVEALRRHPPLARKNIVVLNFSSHGYKQPQQSLLLNYFAALGQHFDLIINMDGFNEGYIGYDNLINEHVDVTMPLARWIYGIQNFFITSEVADQMVADKARQVEYDTRMKTTLFALTYYILKFRRVEVVSHEVAVEDENQHSVKGRHYLILLQQNDVAKFEEAIPSIVRMWSMGSLEMDSVAKRIGAAYIHILQPNQYFGPRPYTELSKGLVTKTIWPFAEIIPPVYRAFIDAGTALRAEEVNFIDATAVFDNHPEPIYYDNCCHFNLHGYKILIDDVLTPALDRLVLK